MCVCYSRCLGLTSISLAAKLKIIEELLLSVPAIFAKFIFILNNTVYLPRQCNVNQ